MSKRIFIIPKDRCWVTIAAADKLSETTAQCPFLGVEETCARGTHPRPSVAKGRSQERCVYMWRKLYVTVEDKA